jgi:pimeloyl-ACP methyl ester carboxylesterase
MTAGGVFSHGAVSLPFEDAGTGDAIVFIHGHPFDRTMWRPQLDYFGSRGRRAIAADLRGYGESTVVPGVTSLSTFAEDIAALLDHLEVRETAVVGLSMGGQIAMECYRLFGQRVTALVLADTFAYPETPEGKRVRHETADRLLEEGMAPFAAEVLTRMITPENARALPDVAEHVLGMMRSTPPEGAAAALRGRAERPDYRPVLGRCSAPTLVIVGSDDDWTSVDDAAALADGIPGGELAVIPGAGHMPNLERPAEFNEVLERFLGERAHAG